MAGVKKAIYTCVTGGYDEVIEHKYMDPSFDYICYTDVIPEHKESIWEFRVLQFDELDSVRNARWHKLHPHELLPDYQESIWIDGNIDVLNKRFFDEQVKLDGRDFMAIAKHPNTKDLWQEFEANELCGKDNINLMRLQKQEIEKQGFNGKYETNRFFETNVVLRKHNNKKCIKLMDQWWWWLQNYSYRDQLSLTYVLWKNKLSVKYLYDGNLRAADFVRFSDSPTHRNLHEKLKRTEVIAQQNAELQQRVAELQQRVAELQQQNAQIMHSLSWRITEPLRKINRVLR